MTSHRSKIAGVVATGLFASPAFSATQCVFDDAAYSIGGTVCECPQLTQNGSDFLVLQRRMLCTQDLTWQAVSDQNYKHCIALSVDNVGAALAILDRVKAETCPQMPEATDHSNTQQD